MVCLFLYGGNDANNVLIPSDRTNYNVYAAARGNLAIPRANLRPLTITTGDGGGFTSTGSDGGGSSGDGLTYAWDFGDGTTGSGASPSHAYAAAGTYTATLKVTDKDGGAGSATANVSITITVQKAASVPVTGLNTAGSEVYGGQHISHVNLAAGQSVTLPLV